MFRNRLRCSLNAKIWVKSPSFRRSVTAVVSSEDTSEGKEEEEKLKLAFLSKTRMIDGSGPRMIIALSTKKKNY